MSLIRNISIFVILTSLFASSCSNKTTPGKYTNSAGKRGELRIMFYNVENLFDIYDDSLKQDNEFLPEGNKHWNYRRFTDKLNK